MNSRTSRSGVASAAALICGLLVATGPAVAQECDVVTLNGRVIDPETGYDAVANVGVKDGSIGAIAEEKITGRHIVDATGHVVARGFTSIHTEEQAGAPLGRDGCRYRGVRC